VHYQNYLGQWRLWLSFLSLLDLLNLKLTMAHVMRGKNGIWVPKKELEKTYTCLCQRTDGQAVCVDVKLLGTTEGLRQNIAILVLLHEYGRVLGAYIMGICFYGTNIVIYVMPGSVRV
jgi:hypothetical protein